MNDALLITEADLREVLALWEWDARNGKTLTHEESRAQTVEECAQTSASYLFEQLKAKA